MSFQISFFSSIVSVSGTAAQIPAGDPIDVVTTSPVTVPDGALFMRIHPMGGTVNVTWPNSKIEYFDAPEYRGCTPADIIAVA